jgi:predicted PurR-regulated permease PerM
LAARDLPALLEKMQPQLGTISKAVLGMVANTAGGVLSFLISLIIAGIMMAYGQAGSEAMLQITSRLTGPEKGPRFHKLSTATIRSVAMGVIGVAFIQALLVGVGFIVADIPAAGILAIIVLILGIAQLPATLITLPVIAFLWWSGDSTIMNVVFSVYLLVAGMSDNVLKPMFLGRGVDAPMPIILIGALGGMVTGGMIGLFLGAVLLTLGYKIFMEWVADTENDGDASDELEPASAQ